VTLRKFVSALLAVLTVSAAVLSGSARSASAATTFTFGRGADGVQLDAAVVTDGESYRVISQGCEGLFAYDKETTNVVPALAEKYEVSKDGLTYTFTLRKGVKFHDGTAFNAEAVKFNFDRWRLTTNPYHFKEQVFEYYEAMFGGFDDASVIKDVTAKDESTVVFTLKAPLAPLLSNLAMTMFTINSPAAIKENGPDYGTQKIGYSCTGPYKFVKWEKDNETVLERYADYWGKVEGNVDTIIIRTIKDNAARFAALQKGELNGMEGVNKEDLKVIEASKDLQVIPRPAMNVFYLAFNFHVKEFQDVKVRKAISMALDRKSIVDAFYGKYGVVANTMLPPSLWGYNKDVNTSKFDVEGAKKLLAEAGFPNGLSEVTLADGKKSPIYLYYMPVVRPYNPDGEGIAQAQAKTLAAAGIKVELKSAGDWAAYLAARSKGELVGLYQLGWTGDNGDPDNFLCYFFCGSEKEPKPQEGFFQNVKLSESLAKAGSISDQAERAKLYMEAEKTISENTERIFIAHTQVPLIFRADVKGYVPNPTAGELYRYVTVAAK